MGFLLLSAVLYALNNYMWKVRLLDLGPLEVTWGRSVFTSLLALGLVTWSRFEKLVTAWDEDGGLYLAAVTAGGAGLLGLVRGMQLAGLVQFSAYYALITIFSGIVIADWTLSTWIGAGLVLLAFSVHVLTHEPGKFSAQANFWLALMVSGFTLSAFLSWTLVRSHPVGIFVATQEWFVLGVTSIGVMLGRVDGGRGWVNGARELERGLERERVDGGRGRGRVDGGRVNGGRGQVDGGRGLGLGGVFGMERRANFGAGRMKGATQVFLSFRENWLRHASFAVVIFLAMYAGDLGLRITDPFLHSASGLLVPVLTAGFGAIGLRESVHWSFPLMVVLMLAGLWVMGMGEM